MEEEQSLSNCKCSSAQSLAGKSNEFLLNSSMHGLKYIGQSDRSLLERLFWTLFFLLGLSTSVYLCHRVWLKWDDSPVLITLDTLSEPLTDSLFPTVTICSVNKVSKRKLTAILKSSDKFRGVGYELMLQALRYLAKIDESSKKESDLAGINSVLKGHDISTDELVRILDQTSPSCDELIIDCLWKSKELNCSELFKPRPTDDGICCSFYNQQVATSEALQGSGFHAGLRIVLDSNLDDYSITTSTFDGFKVLVHGANDFPDVGERGFIVGPGAEVFVGLTCETMVSTEAVSRIPLEKRQCHVTGERQLNFFSDYTAARCLVECTILKIIERCHCQPFYFPVNRSVPCDLESYACASRTYVEIREGTIPCNCPSTCTKYWYSHELSTGPFPGVAFSLTHTYRRLTAKMNYSSSYKDRLTRMSVFFKEKTGNRYIMDIRFGIEDLISSMGGLLGLGLGFSFLSGIELCYFLLCRCCCGRRKEPVDGFWIVEHVQCDSDTKAKIFQVRTTSVGKVSLAAD